MTINKPPAPKKNVKAFLAELDELFATISFEDYIKARVLRYSSLYANSDLEVMHLANLDHELNVNGNGFQSNLDAAREYGSELRCLAAFTDDEWLELNTQFQELTNQNPILVMEGYSQAQLDQHQERMARFSESFRAKMRPMEVPVATLAVKTYERLKAKDALPQGIALWVEDSLGDANEREASHYKRIYGEAAAQIKTAKITPYPNFSYGYSMLYCSPDVGAMMLKHDSWRNAIIKYYQYCEQYFSDPQQYFTYSGAYTPDANALAAAKAKTLEKDFLEAFERYNGDYEKISKAYELDYNGDLPDFLTRKWQRERARIQAFIADTLVRVNTIGNPDIFKTTPEDQR